MGKMMDRLVKLVGLCDSSVDVIGIGAVKKEFREAIRPWIRIL